jgi:hypothetical protein
MLFLIVSLALFWLRTPVESLLGNGVMIARTPQERRTAWMASLVLMLIALICLGFLFRKGQNLGLLLFGVAAGAAFLAQAAVRRLGRHARMTSQVVGALGLTSAAPAAYYLGAGKIDERAFALWLANWIFAGDQIHFVQLRIHGAKAQNFSEKLARGKVFFVAQFMLFALLIALAVVQAIPVLIVVAFIPAIARGTVWFFQKPQALNVRQLGWSEMLQGLTFGVLLTIAFLHW